MFFSLTSWGADKEVPCEQQRDEELTAHCTRTYKCPPTPLVSDATIIGLLQDGELVGVVALKKNSQFIRAEESSIAELKQVFVGAKSTIAKVTYDVSFDGVETDRCYFSYTFNPPLPKTLFSIFTNVADSKLNFEIKPPLDSDLKVFGKTHKLCKKGKCSGDDEWNLNRVRAVTDFNKNGAKEYWYDFADGYRTHYRGEEYDSKKDKWDTIFEF